MEAAAAALWVFLLVLALDPPSLSPEELSLLSLATTADSEESSRLRPRSRLVTSFMAAPAAAAPTSPLWEWPPLGMRASSGRRRGTCHHRHCLRECAGGGYRPADQRLCRPCLDGVYATACPGSSWQAAAPGALDGADCADCSHAATSTL